MGSKKPNNLLHTISLLVLATLSAAGREVHAQDAPQDLRALEMVRAGLDLLQQLDVDAAGARIRDARRRCGRNGCSPHVLALIAMSDGYIAIAGRSDADAALRFFTEALRAEGSIRVDPQIATPEINGVFGRARRQLRGPVGALLHEPIVEQLRRTPIPISVDAGPNVPTRVELSFRPQEGQWRTIRMTRDGRFWGAEIPCDQVQNAPVQYYVTAIGENDAPVAEAGNEDQPYQVEIVQQRTRPSPTLPGRLPPETCRDPNERAVVGGRCDSVADCADGLTCTENVCTQPPPPGPPRVPIVQIEAGGGLGFVAVSGTPAYAEAVVPPGSPDGTPAMCAMVSCPMEASGLAITPYIWAQLRFHIINRFALAGAMRFQPDAASRTTLASVLLSLRAFYALTGAGFARTGLAASIYGGLGLGQISARAPGYQGMPFPSTGHIITGLNNFQAGLRVEYGFGPGVRVGSELTLQFMFPKFVFSADWTVFLGIAFL